MSFASFKPLETVLGAIPKRFAISFMVTIAKLTFVKFRYFIVYMIMKLFSTDYRKKLYNFSNMEEKVKKRNHIAIFKFDFMRYNHT